MRGAVWHFTETLFARRIITSDIFVTSDISVRQKAV